MYMSNKKNGFIKNVYALYSLVDFFTKIKSEIKISQHQNYERSIFENRCF